MADGKRSYTGQYDTRTKTARPTSVGPHHARDQQEDPGNPGIRPEEGYGAEIARNNAAARDGAGRAGGQAPVTPKVKGDPQQAVEKGGPARDAPPLRGTVEE